MRTLGTPAVPPAALRAAQSWLQLCCPVGQTIAVCRLPSPRPVVPSTHPKIRCDLRELIQGCLQILDNFGSQNGRLRQIGRIPQTVIPEPEDIQVGLIALDQVFVREAPEALTFTPLVAIRGVVAAHKLV